MVFKAFSFKHWKSKNNERDILQEENLQFLNRKHKGFFTQM